MPTKINKHLYRVQVYVGKDENGKRVYKSFYGETKKEAEYNALVYKMGAGKEIKKATVTLRAAIEAYIDSKDGILSPATITAYKSIAEHFGDYLDIDITRVNTLNLQTAINQYSKRDKLQTSRGAGKLSAKSIRNAYALINATLRQNGIAILGVTLPPIEETEYNTPFDNDLINIFRAVRGTSVEIPVLLAARCGLRRSEICGLKYTDIDREKGTIRVERAKLYIKGQPIIKGTKTPKSKREIDILQDIIDIIFERLSGTEYVVNMTPNSIGKAYRRVLERHHLPISRFHDLRHAFVSVLHDHQVSDDYLKAKGGWANDKVMRKNYLQINEERMAAAREKTDAIFKGLLEKSATVCNTTSR